MGIVKLLEKVQEEAALSVDPLRILSLWLLGLALIGHAKRSSVIFLA